MLKRGHEWRENVQYIRPFKHARLGCQVEHRQLQARSQLASAAPRPGRPAQVRYWQRRSSPHPLLHLHLRGLLRARHDQPTRTHRPVLLCCIKSSSSPYATLDAVLPLLTATRTRLGFLSQRPLQLPICRTRIGPGNRPTFLDSILRAFASRWGQHLS